MPTDLRTGILSKDEYMTNATLSYIPRISAIPQARTIIHNGIQDKITFKTFQLEESTLRAEILTPEQTEKVHLKGVENTAGFELYLMGAKYIQSLRQGNANIQSFHNQVLRAFSISFDRLAIAGDNKNNGLINNVSNNENYITLANAEIPAGVDTGFNQVQKLREIFSNIKSQVNTFNGANEIIIYYYGQKLGALMDSITESTNASVSVLVKSIFADKNVRMIEIPEIAMLNMGDTNGIVCVCSELVRLDIASLPIILSTGINEEDNYYFANYVYGSSQILPTEKGGIIKQPITFA